MKQLAIAIIKTTDAPELSKLLGGIRYNLCPQESTIGVEIDPEKSMQGPHIPKLIPKDERIASMLDSETLWRMTEKLVTIV